MYWCWLDNISQSPSHVDWRPAEEGLKGTERTMSVSASSQSLYTTDTPQYSPHPPAPALPPHWTSKPGEDRRPARCN